LILLQWRSRHVHSNLEQIKAVLHLTRIHKFQRISGRDSLIITADFLTVQSP
jgi:hypothetical protein